MNTGTCWEHKHCFCWARVLLGQSQVKPWGKTVIRPKVKGLQCLSAQSSISEFSWSYTRTRGLVQFTTGGTWWPLKETLSTVSSEERGTPISQSVTGIENEWWMQTENISRYWCSVISPSPSCVTLCVFVAWLDTLTVFLFILWYYLIFPFAVFLMLYIQM